MKHRPGWAHSWRLTFRRIWPELVLGAAMGIAYLTTVPLWEAPDEPYHLANIAYVRKYGPYTLTHGLSELPQNLKAEASQPPFYYIVTAAVSRGIGSISDLEFGAMERPECWDDAWRFYNYGDSVLPRGLRGVSLLFLLICGLFLGRACVLANPDDPHLPGTAVCMLWAVPQVMFIGTSISNDSMAMAAGSFLLLLWVDARHRPSRGKLASIGLAGVMLLGVKFSLLPLLAAGLVLAPTLGRPSVRVRVAHLVAYAAPAIVTVVTLFSAMPDLWDRLLHIVGSRLGVQALGLRPLVTLPLVVESYWGRFGWMNVSVDPTVRLLFFTLSVGLGMGLMSRLARTRGERAPALISAALAVAAVVALVADLPHSGQAQGRHLFPAIAALSMLGALGLRGYLAPRGARRCAWVMAGCGLLYVVGHVMPAAYGAEPSDLVLGEACCGGVEATPSLAFGGGERQAFVAARHGLTRVGVVPGTYGLPVRGHIMLSLIDRATRTIIASRTFSGRQIRDGRFLYLDFPPIPDSLGRSYIIRIEAVGRLRGSMSLFFCRYDNCTGTGRLTGPGDLRFATYHVPHDRDEEGAADED